MPFASRVLLSAVLALLPIASVPFPAAAAQGHAPAAAAAAPATTVHHPRASAFGTLAGTPRGKAPSALASRASSPAISPRTGSANFVYDGGFETETITPQWTAVSNGSRVLVDTSHPHSGSYSADLCQSTNGCQDVVYQTFTAPAKVLSATLTFWFQFQTQDSTAQPAPCNDFMGAGVGDSGFVVTNTSAVKFCEDWGTVSGYTSGAIDETAYLNAHASQTMHR